jgi:hypothetical protein
VEDSKSYRTELDNQVGNTRPDPERAQSSRHDPKEIQALDLPEKTSVVDETPRRRRYQNPKELQNVAQVGIDTKGAEVQEEYDGDDRLEVSQGLSRLPLDVYKTSEDKVVRDFKFLRLNARESQTGQHQNHPIVVALAVQNTAGEETSEA